ncbi:hypothetical protein TeGR_g4005, partial [Tetraparma gracilis]
MATLSTGSTSGGVAKASGCTVLPSVSSAWQRVRGRGGYVLAGYVGGSKTDVGVLAEGTGDREHVLRALLPFADRAVFGAFSCDKPFQHLFFMGAVGGLGKGRACLHKNAVLNAFEGCAGELTLGLEDLPEPLPPKPDSPAAEPPAPPPAAEASGESGDASPP